MSSQRLQKILAQAGVASRRAAERLITEGRVRVNGRVVSELGSRANPQRDRVEVNGKRLVAERHVYCLLHKPRGVVTTLDDPEGRRTVKDLLRDIEQRVFPVGRLDYQTSGVLLLTNDGGLAQALLHPKRAVPKTYHVKLEGQVDQERLESLRNGVVLDDGAKTAPAEVNVLRTEGKYTSLEITIAEGKNRQIHRMGDAIGRTVVRLTRTSFAGLTLEGLRAGQLRPLTPLELHELKEKYVRSTARRRRPGQYEPEEPVEATSISDEPDEWVRAPTPPRKGPPQGERRPDAPRRGAPAPRRGAPAPRRGAPAPKRGAPAPRRDAPAPKRGAPAPKRGAPAPRRDAPAPKRGAPAPKRGAPAPKRGALAPARDARTRRTRG